MSGLVERRIRPVDQEGTTLSAFRKMGELFVPMRLMGESDDGFSQKERYLVDGSHVVVDKSYVSDNDLSDRILETFDVRSYRRGIMTIGFTLNEKGLKWLRIPVVDLVVGRKRIPGLVHEVELNWYGSRMPEESRQAFRELAPIYVDCLEHNFSATKAHQIKPYPFLLALPIRAPRAK